MIDIFRLENALILPVGYQPSIHQFGSFGSSLLYSYPPNALVVDSLKKKRTKLNGKNWYFDNLHYFVIIKNLDNKTFMLKERIMKSNLFKIY